MTKHILIEYNRFLAKNTDLSASQLEGLLEEYLAPESTPAVPIGALACGDECSYSIFTDGSSLGNPGFGGGGVQIIDHQDFDIEKSFSFGKVTNNEAEYLAVICALYILKNAAAESSVELIMDSQLVGNQLTGVYKVKNPRMRVLADCSKKLLALFKNWTVKVVRREKIDNIDRLAKQGAKEQRTADFQEIKKCLISEGFLEERVWF